MSKTKETQTRITSVENTRKITQAMEMVAATKMKRAIDSALQTRRYAKIGWSIAQNIAINSNNGEELHPFLCQDPFNNNNFLPKSSTVGIVLIASNRGLCGGFNNNITHKVHHLVQSINTKYSTDITVDVIILGKKGHLINKYYGYNISAEFEKKDITNDSQEIIAPTKMAIDNYISGKYSKVYLAYTDYVSAFKQVPRIKQLLPIKIDKEDPYLAKAEGMFAQKSAVAGNGQNGTKEEILTREYVFEPNAKQVLQKILPRLIEVQLFQALLESNASEHSARMVTMHQATDASKNMIEELRLTYNKERQSNITREISEISSSAEALS